MLLNNVHFGPKRRRSPQVRQAVEALDPRQLFSAAFFSSPTTLATGDKPSSVATADVNGDGRADLIVACAGTSPGFVIHLGNGDGGFADGTRVATANSPKGIAVGDFNGDGKVDVAVVGTVTVPIVGPIAPPTTGTLEVFQGLGNGTFQTPATYQIGLDVARITVGDVNNDGRPDLITTSPLSQKVSIFTGRADGTFDAAKNLLIPLQPGSTTVGDFNEDGKLDLVVNTLTDIKLFKGNGDGTFDTGTSIYSFTQSLSLQIVVPYATDLNADGHLDVVVPQLTGAVVQLIGHGDGTFAAPQSAALSLPTGMQANTGLTGDFNHDGIADTAMVDYSTGKLVVDTTATAAAAATQAVFSIGSNPGDLILADVNGDRKLDLIAVSSASNTVSVLLSTLKSTVNGLLDAVTHKLTILGTDGDDTITLATRGTELVVTRAGIPDFFNSADVGSIYLNAGSGNDLVDFTTLTRSVDASGGYGDDTILAGSGNDSIFGSMGDDVLDGGGGDDRIGGWKGKDTLFGGEGDDRLYGYTGDDLLFGNSGKDRLWGEDGDDVLDGGQSNDRLYGGNGNDTLVGSTGNDLLDGGPGKDWGDAHAGDVVDSIEVTSIKKK